CPGNAARRAASAVRTRRCRARPGDGSRGPAYPALLLRGRRRGRATVPSGIGEPARWKESSRSPRGRSAAASRGGSSAGSDRWRSGVHFVQLFLVFLIPPRGGANGPAVGGGGTA